MKKFTELPKIVLLYGFLLWLIPFVISVLVFSVKSSNRPLFDSIMSIVLVFCAVIFTVLYFKKFEKISTAEGIVIGLVWLVISILLDYLFFIRGPAKMNIDVYISDIGINYVMIPAITIGFAYLTAKKSQI